MPPGMIIDIFSSSLGCKHTKQLFCQKHYNQLIMKSFLCFLTLTLFFVTTKAQTAEEAIKKTINSLFVGMKTSDTTLLKTAFADSAILQTIADKDGSTKIITETVADFAKAVSKYPKSALDERIVFDQVKVDGPLAIVWTPYQFYYNGTFMHCGVNSFQLVKIKEQWKIQYLIDTRRKKDCQ
jgi:Putative lumazine-binding